MHAKYLVVLKLVARHTCVHNWHFYCIVWYAIRSGVVSNLLLCGFDYSNTLKVA